MPLSLKRPFRLSLVATACAASAACGGEEVQYTPEPAYTGPKASLPPVPNLQKKEIRQGEAYTPWGVSYYLRSRVHRREVVGKKIVLAGYITKTNLMEAPECAVHKAGEADPEDCLAPIPAFWVGDAKDTPLTESIKVMGWASNFAQIYDAIKEYDAPAKPKKEGEEADEGYTDEFWGVKVPNPLPATGAKVSVTGTYSTTFTQASTGAEADPFMGLLSYLEYQVQEPAPELATLPGLKRKEPK